LYEGGLRIPMIVKWPGHTQPGLVKNELTSTVDILPTMLAAASAPIPEHLPGLNLLPLLQGESVSWREYIFGFGTGSFPLAFCLQHSIRDDRYKLIVNLHPETENLGARCYLDPSYPVTVVSGFTLEEQSTASPKVAAGLKRFSHPPAVELYDLKTDPHEWTDLAGKPEYAEIQKRLEAALLEFRTKTGDPFLDPENVESFAKSQLGIKDMSYRKDKTFRWPYVDEFRKWRDKRPVQNPVDVNGQPD
jgi:N-sulfoglucosamine sulfohydrolase